MGRKRSKDGKNKKKGEKKAKMDVWTSGTKPTNQSPIIQIDLLAKQKLDLYIKHCADEISGLGRVVRSNGKMIITEIILLKQECSSSSSDLDEKELDEFVLTEIEQGRPIEDLKLWWHSHVNMSTFWSSTDTGTIEKLKNGWCISIVGNKSGQYKTRVDLFEPFRYCFDDLPLEIIAPTTPALEEIVKVEIEEKVSKRTYVTAVGNFRSNYYKVDGYDYIRYNQGLGQWEGIKKIWDCVTQKWLETSTKVEWKDVRTSGKDPDYDSCMCY